MYFYPNATAEAAEEAGIRASIGINILEMATSWAQTADEAIDKGLDVYKKYQNNPEMSFTLAEDDIK